MASPPKTIDPPFHVVPMTDYPTGQQFSQPWTDYQQKLSDSVASLMQQMADLSAGTGVGVVDGSDAAAGHVGEYLSASTGAFGLTSTVPIDRVTLTLTAGDWDVAGSATFAPTIANLTFAQAWLATAANTPTDPGRAGVQSGGAGTLGAALLTVGPRRFSVTANTAVHLGCQANFPGGTAVTVTAFIRARRMR